MQNTPTLLRPPRLREGDTLGLFNPSGAIYERAPYEIARETMQALGFRVREAPNLRARYGHMAGTPAQRAADIHALFADPEVQGLLAVTGGSGANRVLPLLDYDLIARHPKFLGGFSDLTALLTAVHVKTGLVTFHSPLARSEWNAFSIEQFKAVAVQGLAHTMRKEPPVVARAPQKTQPPHVQPEPDDLIAATPPAGTGTLANTPLNGGVGIGGGTGAR